MPTAWYYVGGFGALSWVLFTIFAKMTAGAAQKAVATVIGIAGVCFGIIAGGWARRTFVIDIARFASGIGSVVTFVIFIGLLIFVVGYTVAAIIPDGWSPGVSASFGIALVWIVVPSFLALGALPGTWGQAITHASNTATGQLMTWTAGAWG